MAAANKIVLNESANIGQNGAEHDDQFLFKCFVDHPSYAEITDLNTPATFILGSTGAGKTALIRMVKKLEENVTELEIHDLAMNHISNSDTILFMQSLDLDLTLFFQVLWRHALCIEYIKIAVAAVDSDQFRYKVFRIFQASSKQRQREKLEAFVERHEGQFWNTIDENVMEITDALAREFNAEFSSEIKKFVARAGYVHNLGSQQKVQLQQRARRFLNEATLTELPSVIAALSDYTRNRQDKYFITIDGLDENWVDDSIKFQLLQSLFEATKTLKKLRNFQVIVALRNDLYVRMVQETPSSQRQIEKYDDLIIRLKWSKSQLREIADKRIRELFHRKYSSENVQFSDVFERRADMRTAPWDYIIERTLRRPRDVINFINMSLQAAEGKSAVSKNAFLKGEANYSDLRLETLIHEWSSTYPSIGVLLELLRDRPAHRSASELCQSGLIEDLFDSLGMNGGAPNDELWMILENYANSKISLEPIELVRIALSRLHLIGAVGLKLREDRPWDWIYETSRAVSAQQIDPTTKFNVHPMLFASLSVRK